jgi:hypothetical protein
MNAVEKHLQENEDRLRRRYEAELRDRRCRAESRHKLDADFDQAAARLNVNCVHSETQLVTVEPTEYRGIAIDGGVEERCTNSYCNQVVRFVS